MPQRRGISLSPGQHIYRFAVMRALSLPRTPLVANYLTRHYTAFIAILLLRLQPAFAGYIFRHEERQRLIHALRPADTTGLIDARGASALPPPTTIRRYLPRSPCNATRHNAAVVGLSMTSRRRDADR